MASEEDDWWDTETEVQADPGLAPVLRPEAEEIELFPSNLTLTWMHKQVPRKVWAEAKRKSARITPGLVISMAADAEKGLSKRSIMARAGLSAETWRVWEKRAKQGEQPYNLWYQVMMNAMANVEEELLDSIRLQAQGDWKAAKWLLETMNREEYGSSPKNQTVNIEGNVDIDNSTVETNQSVNHMSDERAVEVAQLLAGLGVVGSSNTIEGEVVDEDGS